MSYVVLEFRMKATIASVDQRMAELFGRELWGSIAVELFLLFFCLSVYAYRWGSTICLIFLP